MSDKRDLIVVDIESTGLILGLHIPIEIAAVNVRTNEELYFVPQLPLGALDLADGDAMRINRYFERGAYKSALGNSATGDSYEQLWQMLTGNTFGGSNPRFDADMLIAAKGNYANKVPWATDMRRNEPWHHRLADLAPYAAGVLGFPPDDLRGLGTICELLDVKNDDPHSALGDARATADCFRKLITMKESK